MAPTRTVKSKATKSSRGPGKRAALGAKTKNRVSKKPKAPPPKQQTTKAPAKPTKKKKRVYTDKELGIPKLNMVTPVGVELPKGKRKGKVFVDDQVPSETYFDVFRRVNADNEKESMMTILAIVNANKEGQIESKMMKSRHMEEIRESRHKEAEARQEQRNAKLVQPPYRDATDRN